MTEIPRGPVPLQYFGKDHWSLLGYFECRCTDNKGVPDLRHMRIDPDRHPGLAHIRWDRDIPTRVRLGLEKEKLLVPLEKHDDWDCAEDLEAAGLVSLMGTGIHPWVKLTPLGTKVAAQLRAHKHKGGFFATFVANLEG